MESCVVLVIQAVLNRPQKAGRVQDEVYYSPMMRKLCVGVPAGCRGGFLAEEMGLGKTVRHQSWCFMCLQSQSPLLCKPHLNKYAAAVHLCAVLSSPQRRQRRPCPCTALDVGYSQLPGNVFSGDDTVWLGR